MIISNDSWWPSTQAEMDSIGCSVVNGQRILSDASTWPTANKGRKGIYLFTPEEKAQREAEVAAAQDERLATQWKRDREVAYAAELPDLLEQFDRLIQTIASAKTLKDLQSAAVVTIRMAIKARIPKP